MAARHVHSQMFIRTTPERMWEILSHYGDVSSFHSGVRRSFSEDGSDDRAAAGCERVCNIVDMGMNITLKERIVDYVEGRSYRYEVYEWKNFPISCMQFGFRITDATPGHVTLTIDIDFEARPSLLTVLMLGKVRRLARDVLLGYKHFAETGERRVPSRQLKERYREHARLALQLG